MLQRRSCKTAFTIASRLAGAGFPTDIPRTLFGIPIVLSGNVGLQITLIDAGEILFSDDGAIQVDRSKDASVEMAGVATSPPTGSTVMVPLWRRTWSRPVFSNSKRKR